MVEYGRHTVSSAGRQQTILQVPNPFIDFQRFGAIFLVVGLISQRLGFERTVFSHFSAFVEHFDGIFVRSPVVLALDQLGEFFLVAV